MIRRLIILLLIVGCDYAPTEHTHEPEPENICVIYELKSLGPGDVIELFRCYTDVSETICSAYYVQDDSLKYWGDEYTCEEYCNWWDYSIINKIADGYECTEVED